MLFQTIFMLHKTEQFSEYCIACPMSVLQKILPEGRSRLDKNIADDKVLCNMKTVWNSVR